MKQDAENPVVVKSFNFALRCVKLYKYLSTTRKEYVLSKQLLRSGTSVGANVKEAIRGQSKADFHAKMCIALKEISESEYWLELLYQSEYITASEFTSLHSDCKELLKMLTSITKTTRNNL